MNIPCPVTIDCPGSDFPLENYSSEAPDHLYFAGPGYTPFNPYQPPPIGDPELFTAHDCDGVAFSVLSQEIADLIAAINAQHCQHPPAPPDNPGPFDPKDPLFCNEPLTLTKNCPDGTVLHYTVDAALFCASTQTGANSQALAYGQQQLARLRCPDLRCSITTNSSLPDGTVSTGYSAAIVGTLPSGARWVVTSGTLPPGLTLNIHTGVLSGTPTTAGTYHFTIRTLFP